jgi:hypothetical protein
VSAHASVPSASAFFKFLLAMGITFLKIWHLLNTTDTQQDQYFQHDSNNKDKQTVTHSNLGLETGQSENSWFLLSCFRKILRQGLKSGYHHLPPHSFLHYSLITLSLEARLSELLTASLNSRIPLIQKQVLQKSWYFGSWGQFFLAQKSSKKAFKSVGTSTVVVYLDALSPNP